jgi:hypothetical protein
MLHIEVTSEVRFSEGTPSCGNKALMNLTRRFNDCIRWNRTEYFTNGKFMAV